MYIVIRASRINETAEEGFMLPNILQGYDRNAAENEALRLSKLDPGERVYIYKAIGYFATEKPESMFYPL